MGYACERAVVLDSCNQGAFPSSATEAVGNVELFPSSLSL